MTQHCLVMRVKPLMNFKTLSGEIKRGNPRGSSEKLLAVIGY